MKYETELRNHARLSRKFGSNAEFVFLGGGNTSFKVGESLFIKPSGVELAAITAEDFIRVDRASVRKVFSEPLPSDPWAREAAVKEIMSRAVRPAGSGRPSVETPLHEMISAAYVYHLHPALVNGMTCAKDGRQACAELFPSATWIQYTDPGYTLAATVAKHLKKLEAETGKQPQVIFLQNHGIFVGADSLDEIEEIYTRIMDKLTDAYRKAGIDTQLNVGRLDRSTVMQTAPRLRSYLRGEERRAVVTASPYFEPPAGPLSPDHIVYAGSYPHIGECAPENLTGFSEKFGCLPKMLAPEGESVLFCAGRSLKDARAAMIAARDASRVQSLANAFGGAKYLVEEQRLFIENWEVESYRRKVASGDSAPGALDNRVCVVTGAAQGFGLGIARGLAEAGGTVLLADINLQGAEDAAGAINREWGRDRALALEVDISDESSVKEMIARAVLECGGIDLFVANAGVLRAGSVKTMELRDWQFVTDVNYTGYFLCVKHAAPVMAAEAVDGEAEWSDIVQINSKSGLQGSSRNAAYAGSKFGAIGLTQSFAKELVEDRIKVNSICPGNYFDGPLWSDPKTGLFVQYLETGKVPGAETLDDVKKAYEKKIPMGRGCKPEDVVRAILYLVSQKYETGQAVPVCGGQVMIR